MTHCQPWMLTHPKYVFEALIGPKGLLKDFARILVTHATQFLPQCSQVFLTADGTLKKVDITHQTLDDLVKDMSAKQAEKDGIQKKASVQPRRSRRQRTDSTN